MNSEGYLISNRILQRRTFFLTFWIWVWVWTPHNTRMIETHRHTDKQINREAYEWFWFVWVLLLIFSHSNLTLGAPFHIHYSPTNDKQKVFNYYYSTKNIKQILLKWRGEANYLTVLIEKRRSWLSLLLRFGLLFAFALWTSEEYTANFNIYYYEFGFCYLLFLLIDKYRTWKIHSLLFVVLRLMSRVLNLFHVFEFNIKKWNIEDMNVLC
jgi:hypothetical protein